MSNVTQWSDKHLTKVTTLDSNYQQAALAYNTSAMKKAYFLQDRAEMQACSVAFKHGMMSGIYYGGVAGFGFAIYRRQLRHIPYVALSSGLTYGLLLGSSAWFRFDV